MHVTSLLSLKHDMYKPRMVCVYILYCIRNDFIFISLACGLDVGINEQLYEGLNSTPYNST